MSEEQTILDELLAKWPAIKDKARIARARRIFVDVPAQDFRAVFEHAALGMKFSILCTITGVDLGEDLGAIYHLARESGVMLNLSTSVPKAQPVLRTVSDLFPAADAYEREMIDLLGMQVQGLPPGNRYPLPDNWPEGQYPLRKDWKPPADFAPAEASEASDE